MILAFARDGIGYAYPLLITTEYLLGPATKEIPVYCPAIVFGRYDHEAIEAQSVIKTDQSHSWK